MEREPRRSEIPTVGVETAHIGAIEGWSGLYVKFTMMVPRPGGTHESRSTARLLLTPSQARELADRLLEGLRRLESNPRQLQ